MEELLRKIKTLEDKVEYLVHKEEFLENKNKSIVQDLENVKELATTILNILNLKQQNNINKLIKSINLYKQTKEQHPGWISYILELLDGRIVVGCCGGAISLNQMNYETKEWKVLSQFNNAHNGPITCLCEINNKRVISSSYDKTIKVWNVLSNNGIQLIKTLTQHKGKVWKVITLTCNRLASCSNDDGTVKLYNSETYEQIPIPF